MMTMDRTSSVASARLQVFLLSCIQQLLELRYAVNPGYGSPVHEGLGV